MFDIMSQAQNAIESYNAALKISSSNLANMNVYGYKRLDSSFQSIFEKLISSGTAASGNQGGTNPKQYGQGISISSLGLDFSDGEFSTGSTLDLAISGSGLFLVSPDAGATTLYSRSGKFQIDGNGNLTSNGLQVMGFNDSNQIVPISGLPSAVAANYRWLADGTLQYTTDPTAATPAYTDTGYHIALTYFANPGGLAQAQGSSFAVTLASGEAATPQLPGGAVGSIKPGQLEQSNINYLSETIKSMELQKALSANLSMIRLASDMISSFIQKLG